MNILHVITGLGSGGAEKTLKELVALHSTHARQVVATLDGRETALAEQCRRAGARVLTLRSVEGLLTLIRSERPDLIHAWMYHANLAGAVLGCAMRTPVLWNLRRGALLPSDSVSLKVVSRACATLSASAPAAIVCCSDAVRRAHIEAGYCPSKMVVIPNGVDSARFRPRPGRRADLRRQLGIDDSTFVLGAVGRFAAVKDYPTLLAGFAQFRQRQREACLVLCGRHLAESNVELMTAARAHGLTADLRLLGFRADIENVLPALDSLVCSSVTEGFSNVVVEAMATAVPVIATDVGDNRAVIADTGHVVAVGAAAAIAHAAAVLSDLGRDGRSALGDRARQRVIREYDLGRMGTRYDELYRSHARAEASICAA